VTQDSYHGSVVTGKATGEVLDLSLDDAIQRGLRQNLGLILQTSAVKNANGQRLEELQSLLPTVNATTLPVRSISTARVPPVPTSTPRSIPYHPQTNPLQSVSNASF